jgi:serine/threonine protein kinase
VCARAALETLKSIDILRSLSGAMLKKLAAGLEEKAYVDGEYIVRQGDKTQSLYLIMEGNVRCTARAAPPATHDELLMELSAGAYFGERSLLLNMPRAANVIASRRTTCLIVNKEVFESLLGSLEALIDKDRKRREYIAKTRRQRQLDLGLELVKPEDFSFQCVASEADFGQWVLAQQLDRLVDGKPTSGEFTLKAMSKERAAEGAGARVMQEAKLAAKLVEENRFVPNALQTMASPSYLMTIFSCRVAASLHDVLDLYEHLDEATTLFYAANVFLGLEHLHNVCDVAYRNVRTKPLRPRARSQAGTRHVGLSAECPPTLGGPLVCSLSARVPSLNVQVAPEAIMLGADGYALLMDLRFAREVDTNKLFDVCGLTPYLAPEQVRNCTRHVSDLRA